MMHEIAVMQATTLLVRFTLPQRQTDTQTDATENITTPHKDRETHRHMEICD